MCLDRRTIALMLSGYFSIKSIGHFLAAMLGWTATIPELNVTVGRDISLVFFFFSAVLAVLFFKFGKAETASKGKSKRKR